MELPRKFIVQVSIIFVLINVLIVLNQVNLDNDFCIVRKFDLNMSYNRVKHWISQKTKVITLGYH